MAVDTHQDAQNLVDQLTSQQTSPQSPSFDDRHLRDELKALKESNQALQNHMQMMQWQQQAPKPQPQAFNPFQGKDPKDSILVEDAARSFQEFENRVNNTLQTQLAEVRLASKSSDYQNVINQYLPRAAQEDPYLLEQIKRSPDPMQAAYWAAKSSKAYIEDQVSYRQQTNPQPQAKPKADPEADKMINNLKQSGSIASVASAATSSGSQPDYGRMSDAEFKAHKSGIKFKQARQH